MVSSASAAMPARPVVHHDKANESNADVARSSFAHTILKRLWTVVSSASAAMPAWPVVHHDKV